MDIKEQLEEAKKTAVKGLENAKDALNEATHRTNADAERTQREAAGNVMTPGEKIASAANELKNRAQADLDATKREIRNEA